MTQNCNTILFDLDGTLTDSRPGIYHSIRHALQTLGLQEPPEEELRKFLGPPLHHSFRSVMGMSKAEAEAAVTAYRAHFTVHGIFENEPYPGVREMLEELRRAGRTLLLATAKPIVYARRIMDHFDLARYFDALYGCELDGTRSNKAEVITYTLEQSAVLERDRAVMVGDRCYDIDGAHDAGIRAVAVLYGYGTREELAGADAFADSPAALCALLLGGQK